MRHEQKHRLLSPRSGRKLATPVMTHAVRLASFLVGHSVRVIRAVFFVPPPRPLILQNAP